MDFVAKKDFEAAAATIERALKNNQIEDGFSHELLSKLMFSSDNPYDISISFKQASFIPPDMAVKNKLHLLRQELKLSREGINTHQRSLEKLEKEEQALIALLSKLKE